MSKRIETLSFLIGGLAISTTLSAQTIEKDAIPRALNAKELLILQEKNRRYFDDTQRAADQKKSPPIPYDTPDIPAVMEGDLPGFMIRDIQLNGVTLLPPHTRSTLLSGYLNRTLTLHDITQLSAAITHAYLSLGYVTTRVYLPKQSLRSGTLALQIQEGFVDGIQAQGLSDWQRGLAFFGLHQAPLNIWALETALDQLNRLSTMQATLQLLPSPTTKGGTLVQVTTLPMRSTGAHFRYDTYGDGQVQAIPNSLDLTADNILGSLDQWVVTYYQKFKDKTQFQNSLSIIGSMPVGPFTPKASYSQFNYATLIAGTLRNILTSGQTSTLKVGGSVLIQRDRRQKETLTVELAIKRDQHYIEDTLIGVNSSQLTTLVTGFNHTEWNPWGTLTWDVAYTLGLDAWDATKDRPTLGPDSPHAQFEKMNASFSLAIPLPFPATLLAQANGQYSTQPLYSSERLSIGDYYSVPGYDTGFSGDVGGTAALKLAYTPDWLSRSIAITPALNAGITCKKDRCQDSDGTTHLTSISTALTYRDPDWVAELTAARGLSASEGVNTPPVKWYVSVTRRF